jgi:rhodanese-related sulfurtransferase
MVRKMICNMRIIRILSLCLFLFQPGFHGYRAQSANKYKTISVTSCDSLIKANEVNPDFVILDVRTPSNWLDDHLTGSINRNYYDADFNVKLSALPKHKMYLLHCQSGSRSAATLSMMKNLNFAEVYEMSGGIGTWINGGFPTTSKVAPRLMLVSKGGLANNVFRYGIADTLNLTVTNRANDTLRFISVSLPAGAEFLTDLNLKRTVTGSEDITFSVYYKPLQIWKDSVIIQVVSNGGNFRMAIAFEKQTGTDPGLVTDNDLKIFPNPASSYIVFNHMHGTVFQEIALVNMKGQVVKRVHNFLPFNPLYIDDLPVGMYLVYAVSANRKLVSKLLINRP